MNKSIVIFGCDNTGKTTLANDIVKRLTTPGVLNKKEVSEVKYIRSLGPNKTKEEQLSFMLDNLGKKGIKIFDRFPLIEEATSGVILRNKDNFEPWGANELDLLKNVDLFVFCYPGLFNTLNWGIREQLDGVKDNALQLINAYNCMAYFLVTLGHNVIEYNYEKDYFPVAKIMKELGGV